MPLTVDACKRISGVRGGLGWSLQETVGRNDVYVSGGTVVGIEVNIVRIIVIIVSSSFRGQGAMNS